MKKSYTLEKLCQLIRYDIITSTTAAGSGHPTTSLSAVELMTTLFFNGFLKYDLDYPKNIANDRVIFSKGHASPLLYALYHAAGAISYEKLMTLRRVDSVLEGHPTPKLKFVDVATGSLGQGLSVGVGMAMGIKLNGKQETVNTKREPKVFVLLGDSEMAEGQVWEAMEVASHYKLDNLVAILDVNRLGQRGETMLGWDLKTYAKRAEAFGWNAIVIKDGHDLVEISQAFQSAISQNQSKTSLRLVSDQFQTNSRPTIIIAKTIKGKGVSFLENKDNWHGKAVSKDMLDQALKDIGKVDLKVRGKIQKPSIIATGGKQGRDPDSAQAMSTGGKEMFDRICRNYQQPTATREAYGDALAALAKLNPDIIALDAETSNSTYSEKVKKTTPDQFLEMFIAEQNMVSTALGLSKIGYVPFASSFAAFLTRAFDQIRMGQYSDGNVKIVGSHAGVSIGVDGSSQMALEDIAMMRSVLNSVVLYPSDAVSTFKLTELMAKKQGMFYLRATREKTPVIYKTDEKFEIGGAKIIYKSKKDIATVIAAGITLHEAVKAYYELKKQGIDLCLIDLYCIKPINKDIVNDAARRTKNLIVVEDHYPYGGIGEAVKSVLETNVNFVHLAVNKIPRSGKPEELLKFEEIDKDAIIKTVKQAVTSRK